MNGEIIFSVRKNIYSKLLAGLTAVYIGRLLLVPPLPGGPSTKLIFLCGAFVTTCTDLGERITQVRNCSRYTALGASLPTSKG